MLLNGKKNIIILIFDTMNYHYIDFDTKMCVVLRKNINFCLVKNVLFVYLENSVSPGLIFIL